MTSRTRGRISLLVGMCLCVGLLGGLIQAPLWASVKLQTIAANITTNTTSTATPAEIAAGDNPAPKSFYGQVVGTGAVTQTQAIYGDIDNDAANGILLCTMTLSGTTRAQDACPVITATYAYYYVITTNTTGTGATGAVYAMY